MYRLLFLFVFIPLFTTTLAAQSLIKRHNFDLAAVGVFPVSGFKADEYSAGPALHAGYELRLQRHVAADIGWTGAWLSGTSCSRFGCTHPRYENRLIDYGLRGVLPLARDRVEVSLGLGGGYIWFNRSSGDDFYNGSLLQYSAKAAVGIDRSGRMRVEFGVRAFRDLGRPIQQWLSTAAGISYGFGAVK